VLLLLERVHRRPETVVSVRHQLVLGDQPPKRLLHEVVAFLDVVEDLPSEDEVAAVDPHVRIRDVVDLRHRVVLGDLRDVEVVGRARGDEECGLVGGGQHLDHVWNRGVGQRVAVVRQEDLVVPM
jgi:hypothetical protein